MKKNNDFMYEEFCEYLERNNTTMEEFMEFLDERLVFAYEYGMFECTPMAALNMGEENDVEYRFCLISPEAKNIRFKDVRKFERDAGYKFDYIFFTGGLMERQVLETIKSYKVA